MYIGQGMNLNYLIFMLPGLLLSLWAQSRVKGAYSKWSQVRNSNNVTGMETAELLKPRVGLQNVQLGRTKGQLSDHYDPTKDTLALSEAVADHPSVAAMAITAHELGHALQDKEGYGPMRLRSAIVPLVSIGSNIGMLLVMVGLALSMMSLFKIGIILFASTSVFSLVTLPVELKCLQPGSCYAAGARVGAKRGRAQRCRPGTHRRRVDLCRRFGDFPSAIVLLYFPGWPGQQQTSLDAILFKGLVCEQGFFNLCA